jgi:hypothetical protein
MIEETKWMKNLLPSHYTCEPRENGVHCHSPIGIDENDPEQWDYTFKAIKQKFGERFMEVFHQTCTNHVKFTVYLRKG